MMETRGEAGLAELQAQLFREGRLAGGPMRHLMTAVLDRRNLEAAFDKVRSADGANTPGLDGVSCAEARADGGWLNRLAEELYSRRFRFTKPRWVEIPKPNKPGEVRKLGILTVRDRVVHTAIKQALEPVLDPVFVPESFGFRPGRSVAAALAEATYRLTPPAGAEAPFGMAVHLDVASCFDTIDHQLLLDEVARHVGDGDLLRLMKELMEACATGTRGWFWTRGVGLCQGSSLSPLLCNLALHPLDVAVAQFARTCGGRVCMLRYADDLLLLAKDQRHMDAGLAEVRRALGRLQQELRTPLGVPRPAAEGVDWLGVRLQPRRRPWSMQVKFGYAVPDAKVAEMLRRLEEITTPPSERIDPAVFNLSRWVVSVNTQLRDWREAYCYADNAHEVFAALDEQAQECVGRLIVKVTGVRPARLTETYRVRLPRGFATWEVSGARLVVLSSLAPRHPFRLVRLPAWAREGPPRPRVERVERPGRLALPGPKQAPAGQPAPAEGDDEGEGKEDGGQ